MIDRPKSETRESIQLAGNGDERQKESQGKFLAVICL
jgi:hypothetical protein